MWLLWEEKVLIREIWLNIYLPEMLNSNRKFAAYRRPAVYFYVTDFPIMSNWNIVCQLL